MARRFASFLLIWTLLLGPALCVGGLIEHSCACEDGEQTECEHDEGCADDVCASVVRTQDPDLQADLDIGVTQVNLLLALHWVWTAELKSVAWRWPSIWPGPPDRWNLPYAQSDRPQLI